MHKCYKCTPISSDYFPLQYKTNTHTLPGTKRTLALNLDVLQGLLSSYALSLRVEDDIFALEGFQLVGEAAAGWLKFDLLQQHLLGRGGQQPAEVSLVGGVLAARLQHLFQLLHDGHGASLRVET